MGFIYFLLLRGHQRGPWIDAGLIRLNSKEETKKTFKKISSERKDHCKSEIGLQS